MCSALSAKYAVGEVEVVPRDLVAEDRRPLERAQALLRDRLVVLVDVVMRGLEDDVGTASPPRARRAARGCPAAARGTSARRSRAPSGSARGCRARSSPRAPRGRACPAGSPPAASAWRSRRRRSGRRTRLDEPRHRAAAAELAVVRVRREHERALPGLGHRAHSLSRARRSARTGRARAAAAERTL